MPPFPSYSSPSTNEPQSRSFPHQRRNTLVDDSSELCLTSIAAQCDGPIEIQNQGDATALSSCSTVEGDVEISSEVQNTISLDGVERITGDLRCINASGLIGFSAPRLAIIDGRLDLQELQVLSTLQMDSLAQVLTIKWKSLPALQSLAFTRGVSKVTNIQVSDTGLTSLNGLELDTVGRMDINNNKYLETVDVNNMANVTESISFEANSKSLNIKLPNLEFAANMTFKNVSGVEVPSLTFVNGSIGFYSNAFQTISLPNLTETGQALVFQDCPSLTNISAPMLKKVGAALNINDNAKLIKIDGFPALEVIAGALDVTGSFDESVNYLANSFPSSD
jgi:hypothetical protein